MFPSAVNRRESEHREYFEAQKEKQKFIYEDRSVFGMNVWSNESCSTAHSDIDAETRFYLNVSDPSVSSQYLYVPGAAVHAHSRRPVCPQHGRLAARPLQSPLPLPAAHAARPGRAGLPRILLSERGQQHGQPGLHPHSAGHQRRQCTGRQRQLPPHTRCVQAAAGRRNILTSEAALINISYCVKTRFLFLSSLNN